MSGSRRLGVSLLFEAILHDDVVFPAWLSREATAILKGFMTKPVNQRLGCGPHGADDIRRHPFFAPIDWAKLERREIAPPFKPRMKSPKDASNFDSDFTSEAPKLTPCDRQAVENIDQTDFRDFTFVNPHYNAQQIRS